MRSGQVVNRPLVGKTTKNYKIVLRGANFDANTNVLVNGIETTVELTSATELRATLPAGKFGRFGGASVQVRAQNGQVSSSLHY